MSQSEYAQEPQADTATSLRERQFKDYLCQNVNWHVAPS